MRGLLTSVGAAGLVTIGCYFAMADHHPDQVEEKVDKMKSRLEQLFIWRVTDRLSLTPNQELTFTKIYKEVAQDRQKYAQKLEKILDQMESTKSDKELERLLAEYRDTLKSYNECQTRELDSLKKVFDSKKLSQYMLVKRDMTRRFKDVLSQGNAQASRSQPALKEPEVIQEK